MPDKDRNMKSVKKKCIPRAESCIAACFPFLGTFFKPEKKKFGGLKMLAKYPPVLPYASKEKENTELAVVSWIMFPIPK